MQTRVVAGFWDLDLDTREVLLCPHSQRMFGVDYGIPRRLAGYEWGPRIDPEDMPVIEGELEFAYRTRTIYAARFRVVRPDGSVCQVLGIGRSPATNPRRFVGLNFDLDDAAGSAERLSQSLGALTNLGTKLVDAPANENQMRAAGSWRPYWQTDQTKLMLARQRSLHKARAMTQCRELRKTFLSPAMFGEPAFELLLTLYASSTGAVLMASELFSAASLNASVAMRWLKFLAKDGLVLTAGMESGDPELTTVALTDRARIALDEYFKWTESLA